MLIRDVGFFAPATFKKKKSGKIFGNQKFFFKKISKTPKNRFEHQKKKFFKKNFFEIFFFFSKNFSEKIFEKKVLVRFAI